MRGLSVPLPQSYRVNAFISHSWAHSHHYRTLSDWIFGQKWYNQDNRVPIYFGNNSIPKDNPIHNAGSDQELARVIYDWISRSDVVVIPTGMYATHSKWINKEIAAARFYGKPILAVNPRAQERKSSVVVSSAHRLVGWSSLSVARGIWDLSRGV